MNAALKRGLAEKVRRHVTTQLAMDGFTRTKPTFWTRPADVVVEFLHLHLYRANAMFRAHIGVRAWDDPFDAIALNGPASHPTDAFSMVFSDAPASIEPCAKAVVRYTRAVGEPWWRDLRRGRILTSDASPLDATARSALRAALDGHVDADARARTRLLLGVV